MEGSDPEVAMTLLYLRNKIVDNSGYMRLKRSEAETVLAFIESTLIPLKQAGDVVKDNPDKAHLLLQVSEAIGELQNIADEITLKIKQNPTPYPGVSK